MAQQIDARNGTPTGTGRDLGWLSWWTLHKAERTVQDVQAAAKKAGIPQWMQDRIAGRTDKSAWLSATQLGARGENIDPVTGDPADSTVRFLTRDIKANETRALVREVTDTNGEQVSSDTVAQIYFNATSGMTVQMAMGLDPALQAQVDRKLSEMKAAMGNITGKIDDTRVRSLILDWLEKRNRVTVRGTGGVYLVPRPNDDTQASEIEQELLKLRAWVAELGGGLFSIVQVSDRGATTVDAFVAAALEELRSEIETVNGNIEKWTKNPNMNDGSRMFSADSMLTRLDALQGRMKVLIESLGDEIGVVESMFTQVLKKVNVMRQAATDAIGSARGSRSEEGAAKRAEKLNALKTAREEKLATVQAERAEAKSKRDADKAEAARITAEKKAQRQSVVVAPVVVPITPVAVKRTKKTIADLAAVNGGDSDVPVDSGDLAEVPSRKGKKQGVSRKAAVKL